MRYRNIVTGNILRVSDPRAEELVRASSRYVEAKDAPAPKPAEKPQKSGK